MKKSIPAGKGVRNVGWITNSTDDGVVRTAANLFSNRYFNVAAQFASRTFIRVPLGIVNAESAPAQLGSQLSSAAVSHAAKKAAEYFFKAGTRASCAE
ncbi:MAG: hypothetical protein WB791_10500 [Waddliaceae bacterium]